MNVFLTLPDYVIFLEKPDCPGWLMLPCVGSAIAYASDKGGKISGIMLGDSLIPVELFGFSDLSRRNFPFGCVFHTVNNNSVSMDENALRFRVYEHFINWCHDIAFKARPMAEIDKTLYFEEKNREKMNSY